MTKRVFEGTLYLQDIGEVEGIKAKNLRVGDFRVWNGGSSSEIVRIEASASGKTLKVTTKWFNEHARVENGQWVAEWQEDTRTVRTETIVAVKELNPAEEVAEIEEAEEITPAEVVEAEEKEIKVNTRKSAFEKWLETFLDEKCVDMSHSFTVDHKGTFHIVDMEFLKEVILKASEQEQRQIKDKIVYIDFKNGDVMHFFNFLAGAYIKTNY